LRWGLSCWGWNGNTRKHCKYVTTIVYLRMDFVWDEKKNEANKRKHSLSFEDARNVFADPLAIVRVDTSSEEFRWQIMGHWGETLLILVVYTLRGDDGSEAIRIISARKATNAERRRYEKGQWV